MILLINNCVTTGPDDISFVPKIRKALRKLNIPLYEVKKIQTIPNEISSILKGIIISGSKLRLSQPLLLDDYSHILHYIMKFNNLPILGLCFGCQLLHILNGGKLQDQIQLNCSNYRTELTTHPLFQNVSFLKKNDTYHKFSVCFHDLPLEFNKKSLVKHIAYFHHRDKLLPCAFEYSKICFGMMIHPEMYKETYNVFSNFVNICNEKDT